MRRLLQAALATCAMLAAVGCSRTSSGGFDVYVINRSEAAVSDVAVELGTSYSSIGYLPVDMQGRARLDSAPGVPLILQFTDERGLTVEKRIELTLEEYYGGSFKFVIARDGQVQANLNVFFSDAQEHFNPMSNRTFVIGVDGGGTKTLGALMTGDGRILARETFPSTNPHTNPGPAVQETLTTLVTSLCERAGIMVDELAAICLGMAGCDSEADRANLDRLVRPALVDSTRRIIVNDAIVAMTAVLGRLHGILLIAGTGSICMGCNERTGVSTRCGGWGHILADEGSGYAIGLAGLKAVLHETDGRGPATSLTKAILSTLEMKVPRDLISFVYGPEGTKARIAAVARVVLAEDEAGDAVAGRILDDEAASLARLIRPVYDRGFEPEDGTVSLGLWGGNLVHVARYRERFLARLGELMLPVEPILNPTVEAVDGAAKHALNVLAGADVWGSDANPLGPRREPGYSFIYVRATSPFTLRLHPTQTPSISTSSSTSPAALRGREQM